MCLLRCQCQVGGGAGRQRSDARQSSTSSSTAWGVGVGVGAVHWYTVRAPSQSLQHNAAAVQYSTLQTLQSSPVQPNPVRKVRVRVVTTGHCLYCTALQVPVSWREPIHPSRPGREPLRKRPYRAQYSTVPIPVLYNLFHSTFQMASAAIVHEHVRLARSLPAPLLNFFKKYPPQTLQPAAAAAAASPPSTEPQLASLASNTSSADPNANTPTQLVSGTAPAATAPEDSSLQPINPFLPWKNPRTLRWQPPAYSLRRQAELVKLAQKHHITSLLPWTPKLPSEIEKRRAEHGLRVKGTGVGQKVKGKMWERTLKGRLDERRKAMEAMPEMIRHWKERGHGRGWKKWPK